MPRAAPEEVRFRRDARLGVEAMTYRGPAKVLARHAHAEHQLTLYAGPPHRLEVAGRTVFGGPGAAVIVQAGEAHASSPAGEDPLCIRVLYVDAGVVDEAAATIWRGRGTVAFREPVLTDVLTIAALEAAHRALDDEDGLEAEVVYREALERLLRLHATPTGSPLRSAGAPARVARAREFLSEHVADDVALDDLVAAAGLSRYHLIRAFRQEYGLTPFAFHRRQRVERAREVLRRGGSIASAVAAARFADQSHLGRVFTATFGVTPGEYRRCFETPSRSARRASRLTAFGE